MIRFPSRPGVPTPAPAPAEPPALPADFQFTHPDNDLQAPYGYPPHIDASNPARPTIILLVEGEDPQLTGIKGALNDRIAQVRLERNRAVSQGGNRTLGSVLVFEKRSELKSLLKLDVNNPKLVEQVVETAFEVQNYWLNSGGKPEALDPRGFYLKGGSQVVYLPGPPRKGNWSEGIEPYLGPAARNRTEGRLSEDEATDNFGRVLFRLVHGVAPGADRQAVGQVVDRRLAKAWKQVFRPGTKLRDAQRIITAALTTVPPPDTKLRPARPPGQISRLWLLLLVLLLLGAVAAYLLANGSFARDQSKNGTANDPTPNSTAPSSIEPKPPIPPTDPVVLSIPKEKGTPPANIGDQPVLVLPTVAPDGHTVKLEVPAGHEVFNPTDPDLLKALESRIKELAETQDVKKEPNGVWVIKNSRRYVREIALGLRPVKYTPAQSSQEFECLFDKPREVTTAHIPVKIQASGIGSKVLVELELFAEEVKAPNVNTQPLWSKIELVALPDPDNPEVKEALLRKMSGVLPMNDPMASLSVPTIVGHPYKIVAHRIDGGDRDVYLNIVICRQKKKEIEQDITTVFLRAGMPPPKLSDYYIDRGDSTYVPNLRKLLAALRTHFHSQPGTYAEKASKQHQQNPVYRYETAPIAPAPAPKP
jgi:hypothetical protein